MLIMSEFKWDSVVFIKNNHICVVQIQIQNVASLVSVPMGPRFEYPTGINWNCLALTLSQNIYAAVKSSNGIVPEAVPTSRLSSLITT